MKYGCCIPINYLSIAKENGFDFAELSGVEVAGISSHDWENTKEFIRQANIPIIGFNSFCDKNMPLVGPDVNVTQQNEYIDLIITRGHQLGIKNIGIGAPSARHLPETFIRQEADLQMIRFLSQIGKRAKEVNINILMEALNPFSCNYINTVKEAANLVKEAKYSNIFVVWDLYHSVLAGEQFSDVLPFSNLIRHVHICSWDTHTRSRHFIKSKDSIYLKQLSSFLQSIDYDRTVSIEAKGIEIETEGNNSIRMLKEFLK